MVTKKGKAKSGKIIKVLPLSTKTAGRIKALRLQAGFTAAETFAFTHGFNRSQYIAYEKGVDIRLSTLERICQAHGITIAAFFSEGFD